jgi:RNA polymerase sigma-70 factor (ECF subfamily)
MQVAVRRTGVRLPFSPEKFNEMAATADAALFSDFVTSYQPIVYRWALTFAGDSDEAEDLTQETFIRAYRKRRQYRGEGSIEGWLYRVVRSVGSDRRRVSVRRRVLGRSILARPDREVYTTDPGGRIDRERVSALIRRYFEDLPQRQREIFDLVDLQQYTPAEVALMTGLNAGAVRASLFKARAVIRAKLVQAFTVKGDIV